MELKVVCRCGQKFKFDVEPVNGQMPFTVKCPLCEADGTATANGMLAAMFASQPSSAPVAAPPPASPPPSSGGLRLSISGHTAAPPTAPAESVNLASPEPMVSAAASARPIRVAVGKAAAPTKKPSFAMGMLGGLIGALVGLLAYFLIFKYTGVRIKFIAIGVGALAGWFGDFLGKGEGSKELGGIIAVFVLGGLIGVQYFVTLGWWHENRDEDLKLAESAYTMAVTEAKEAVKAVPTGTDAEIRAYLVKLSAQDDEKASPGSITAEEVQHFREQELPEYQRLASGTISRADYERANEIKSSMTNAEKQEDDNTFKGFFLLFLLSKSNLISLAAAAGLAFKLSTNA